MLTTETSLPFFCLLQPAFEVCGDQKQEAMRRITATAISALRSYLARDLLQFDAKVGDEACQIRALWIIQTFSQIDSEVENSISQFQTQKLNESFTLPPSICFLLFSAFTVKGNKKIVYYESNGVVRYRDREAPGLIIGVGKTEKILTAFSFQVVKQAKKVVNSLSMTYILDLANGSHPSRRDIIKKALTFVLPGKLQQLSFYHLSEIVFSEVEKAHIPILIKARGPKDKEMLAAKLLLYRFSENDHTYQRDTQVKSEEVVFVIEGISKQNNSEAIAHQIAAAGGLMEIIRLNLAQHRLTPKMTDEADREFSQKVGNEEVLRIAEEKKRAEQLGFAHDNYTVFRITHIFADQMKGYM